MDGPDLATALVKRDALVEVKSLSAPPEALDGRARKLRALIVEIAHRIAENDQHHRLPDLASLVQEIKHRAAELGYPQPPLRLIASGDRKTPPETAAASRPYWVLELFFCEPGHRLFGMVQIEAWYGGASRPVIHENLRGRPEYITRVLGVLLRWVRHIDLQVAGEPGGNGEVGSGTPPFDSDSYITSVDIAKRLGLRHDPVRTRLNRWRKANFEGWREMDDPGPKEPKYLFRVSAILDVIEELRATATRPRSDRHSGR